MAKPILLSLSLCLLVLFNGCLARQHSQQQQGDQEEHQRRWQQQQQRYGECQLDRIDAREPDNRVEAEAGTIETWNPNDDQFRCAGVAISRIIIERQGLQLPAYSNSPKLLYIERGRGFGSVIIPGCPETYQESQGRSGEFGQRGGKGSMLQDQHQKIRHFRQGDIIAVPAGAACWMYNNGDNPLVAIVLHDTSNNHNQLDQNPRKFYLAGNPDEEFPQTGQQGPYSQQLKRQHEGGQQQQESHNIFAGFDERFLAEAFNVDIETARRLQSRGDDRRNIVRVQGNLDVVRPPTSRHERERQGEESREWGEREGRRGQSEWGREGRRGYGNGFEETICSARLSENIGDRSRADIFSPEAGRISTVNSHTLPVLNWLRLSAERGFLYSNALYVPHWNLNAHSIIYAIRGRARVQIVDDYGQAVFDGELQQGQVLTVPQNYAVAKRADSEGFEWVSFKTNDNAMTSPLAGRTSVIRALPVEVLANGFRISPEEARQLKFNTEQISLVRPQRSSGRRAEA